MIARGVNKGLTALARLMVHCDPRSITRRDAQRCGLLPEFELCKRAGLIQSAGYETSVAAEDWLNSAHGQAAVASARNEAARDA